MSEQSEKLAANIRKALGNHNDNNEAVTILVTKVCQQLDQAMADVARLREAASNYAEAANKSHHDRIAARYVLDEVLSGTSSDAFIKLKQAEAVEDAAERIRSVAATNADIAVVYEGLLCEAQRLRGEVDQ